MFLHHCFPARTCFFKNKKYSYPINFRFLSQSQRCSAFQGPPRTLHAVAVGEMYHSRHWHQSSDEVRCPCFFCVWHLFDSGNSWGKAQVTGKHCRIAACQPKTPYAYNAMKHRHPNQRHNPLQNPHKLFFCMKANYLKKKNSKKKRKKDTDC